MAASASTMSLSWLPPEKPNGIILDYEIKYHEKVRTNQSYLFCLVFLSLVVRVSPRNLLTQKTTTVLIHTMQLPILPMQSFSMTHSFLQNFPPLLQYSFLLL